MTAGRRLSGRAGHARGNGALFGAAYANAAHSLPLPAAARGPLAGLAEHLATWPAGRLMARVHPAAGDLPQPWGLAAFNI